MTDADIQQHLFYKATIRIRTQGMPPIRPEALEHDGKRLVFYAAWPLDGEDARPHYAGEWAMTPRTRLNGLIWIASGDLTDVIRVDPSQPA